MDFNVIISAFIGLLGVVVGLLGSEYISNRELKVSYLKDLNNYVSQYLSLIRSCYFYYEQYSQNDLKDEATLDQAIGALMQIQIFQNRLDIIIKDNDFSNALYVAHNEITKMVFELNDAINGKRQIEGKTKFKKELDVNINNYLKVVNELINNTFSSVF